MLHSGLEIADVIRHFGKQYIQRYRPSPGIMKILFDILQCRTSALGGHEDRCNSCCALRYSYNSCRNRHCPKCLATKQAIWVDNLIAKTLAVKHYHIIFTVPHVLNTICLYNRKLYYKLLFSAVWKTLHSFGYTHFGVETGAICVLHSWGQNLSLHPHIHCIVPAAGYSIKGTWKPIGTFKDYLYPVHQLSDTFKGKFLDSLKRALNKLNILDGFNPVVQQAYQKRWVVNRVAISNKRILEMSDTHVKFIAKDYRDNAQKKPVNLSGVEFLRRFFLHVLPKRFVKIRRYGIYNHTTQRNLDLQFEVQPSIVDQKLPIKNPVETTQERIKRLTGFDIGKCTKCSHGRMILVRELPKIRSPSKSMKQLIFAFLQ